MGPAPCGARGAKERVPFSAIVTAGATGTAGGAPLPLESSHPARRTPAPLFPEGQDFRMSPSRTVLLLAAALGCGTMAGVFFAFSAFVMRGLGRLPAPQGIAAMQSINVSAVTPPFMAALFGTAAACVAVAVSSWSRWGEPGAAPSLAGSLLYLVGTILVTIAFNVPRNEALAGVDPHGVEGARLWSGYLRSWTAWNHVRTVAALAAAASITWALLVERRP